MNAAASVYVAQYVVVRDFVQRRISIASWWTEGFCKAGLRGTPLFLFADFDDAEQVCAAG